MPLAVGIGSDHKHATQRFGNCQGQRGRTGQGSVKSNARARNDIQSQTADRANGSHADLPIWNPPSTGQLVDRFTFGRLD